jgi:predicted nucleic acid-binding Zn ribbon protein
VRRVGPRPLAAVLPSAVEDAAPAGLLARVQAAWAEAAGDVVAAEARPIAERAGTVTIACRSASWAQELELLAPDLLVRLNVVLGAPHEHPLKRLRFRTVRML